MLYGQNMTNNLFFNSVFLNKINIIIGKIVLVLHVLMSNIVSNPETGLCCLILLIIIFKRNMSLRNTHLTVA